MWSKEYYKAKDQSLRTFPKFGEWMLTKLDAMLPLNKTYCLFIDSGNQHILCF